MPHWTEKHDAPALFGRLGVGGSNATQLATIIAGSAQIATSALGAQGSATAASVAVTGLTANHKVFISGCTAASSVVLAGATGVAGGFTVRYVNAASGEAAASTLTVDFFALRDY